MNDLEIISKEKRGRARFNFYSQLILSAAFIILTISFLSVKSQNVFALALLVLEIVEVYDLLGEYMTS